MELMKEKLNAIEVALDCLYPDEILRKILAAKDTEGVAKALKEGRESL